MIRYISTRGANGAKSFTDVTMAGLAPDGGLYVPDSWPDLDTGMISHLSGQPYTAVASTVMAPFIGDSLPPGVLQALLARTYESGAFDHAAIAPLVQVGPNAWILELFHGPTISFKDYALQFLGRLFDYLLTQRNEHMTIIGATSGDTGSAAIEACRRSKNISTFILHPKGRISDVQRRQMTTVDAPNVFNIAIEGSFDDCQALVKAMLNDKAMQQDLNLSAVNSINWVRIMAQVVYYVYAGVALGAPYRDIAFTVPTGNFGNAYAAWVARRIGLPIHKMTVATNRNDILTRFFESGDMRIDKVMPSITPSMDIQVSSNFERYLHDILRGDHAAVTGAMQSLNTKKSFTMDPSIHARTQMDFSSARVTDPETLQMMRECYEHTGVIIDPHTAVGLHATLQRQQDPTVPVITVATAHPAKFPDAVEQATGIRPALPPRLSGLMDKAEHVIALPNDLKRVSAYIRAEASTR